MFKSRVVVLHTDTHKKGFYNAFSLYTKTTHRDRERGRERERAIEREREREKYIMFLKGKL